MAKDNFKKDNFKKDAFNSPDDVYDLEKLEDAGLDAEENSDEPDPFESETDKKILEKFKKDLAAMDAHWGDIYARCAQDWDIYTLDQWTEDGKRKRGKRPRLTMDITRKFVKSIVAETFRNPPGIKLTARSQQSSLKAQAISDAVRYFEDRTGAIYAYSGAKEACAVAGIGWLKVTYRYDTEQAMPSVIDIDRIDDPLSIKIDPDSRELDGSDAMFALEEHGKKDGELKYTYWWKDEEGRVKWAVICDGKKIEDKGVFPASDIPIVPVYGEVTRIRGKTRLFGVIRQLADVQRSYNYTMSEGIERLALTPKSPIRAAVGSISEQHLPDWLRSLTDPVGVLFHNAVDANGNPLPAPNRESTSPDTEWLPVMIQMLQQSAKETIGIYDTALGDQSGEQSGVAIKARIESGDRGHLVYDEHLQISIKHVGRIVLSMLDSVVTPAGVLPLLAEDGTTSTIPVGMDPVMAQMQGIKALPDLDATDLEISVSAAPAYATRKQAGLDNVTELLKILPPEQVSTMVPSIIRDMDFPGSETYANLLDPNAKSGDPAAMAQQLQQLQEQLSQATQQLTDAQNQNMQLTMQLNSNTQAMLAKANIDANVKLATNQNDNQTKMAIANMQVNATAAADDKKMGMQQQQLQQKNAVEMAKIGQQAESDNAEIAAEAVGMKLDALSIITKNGEIA